MKKTLLVPLALLLAVTPAFARWEFADDSNDSGDLFVASQIDTTNTIEVQVLCDEALDGKLLFSIFTGIDPGKRKDFSPPVPVTVAFGSVVYAGLEGTVVDIEDERILDISEADESDVRNIAHAIRKGKEMSVAYLGEHFTVPAQDAPDVLAKILERCP